MIAEYRKAIAAVVGLALILVHRATGLDFGGIEPMLVDSILAGLTALGVYGLRNDDPPPPPGQTFLRD